MESRASTPTITVLGTAVIRAEPDEATLTIVLQALEDHPGSALSNVSGRSSALIALLDELGVPKTDRSTTALTVEEEFDHTEKGRRSLGHRATSRLSVRLTKADLIGQLVTAATAEFAAVVHGPQWFISLDNPVRLEAARQAAADARRKAQAYVEGFGAALGRLVLLSEPGTSPPMAFATGLSSGGAVRHARRQIPVEAGEHEVEASIEATFELEPG